MYEKSGDNWDHLSLSSCDKNTVSRKIVSDHKYHHRNVSDSLIYLFQKPTANLMDTVVIDGLKGCLIDDD